MPYTSVLYKNNNNKVYIGVLEEENGLKEITAFKPLPYYRNIEVKDNVMYVVMVDDNLRLYELDKVSLDNLLDDKTTIGSFEPDELLLISNRLLQRHQTNLQYH